jgi:uncharacterized membrane protein
MKSIWMALAVGALAGLVGCNNGTPGGPGADKAKEREKDSTFRKTQDKIIQPEDTFKLSLPTFSTKIKQGETKEIDIGIKRGKNFGEDVSIKFEELPRGVTIDPAAPTIKSEDKEVKLSLKAAKEAALGDFTIKVSGHPEKGADSTNEMKVTVEKK